MIQPHHLHTHGPDPLYTPVKADDVRPKIEVRKFDLDDETTWPDPERDGEVLAEKDEKIAELKEHNENYRFDNKNMLHKIMQQDAELRRQKYKRCLAMFRWCYAESWNCPEYKERFYTRWTDKWRQLAEKFKEA